VKDTSESRKRFAGALTGVPKRAIKAIERMQPYHGPGEPRDRPLAVLNALVNEDKHRSLLTVRLAVPLRDFYGAFNQPILIEHMPELADSMRRFLEETADRNVGAVVLVDPAKNSWEHKMEMEGPAVKVVTNAAPHREIIEAFHELRVVVVQALDKLVTYLRDDEPRPPEAMKVPPFTLD
jgi:hypothetical protein